MLDRRAEHILALPVEDVCKCGYRWAELPPTLRMLDMQTWRGYCGGCKTVMARHDVLEVV